MLPTEALESMRVMFATPCYISAVTMIRREHVQSDLRGDAPRASVHSPSAQRKPHMFKGNLYESLKAQGRW